MADDKKQTTEYVVLAQSSESTWEEVGTVKAASQAAAKRSALAQHKPEGGIVVAVPTRSWEPEDLRPKLSFG
jgi:hypothetical protein